MPVNLFKKTTAEKTKLLSHKILIVISILTLSINFYKCSDAPSSIGVGLLSPDEIDVIKLNSYTDTLSQSSRYFQQTPAIGLSSASYLLLGKKNNVEASLLLRFFSSLSDSIKNDIKSNSVSITSSYLKFIKTYTYGDSTALLDFTAHKVNSQWSIGFTTDSLPSLSYDQNDLILNKEFSDSINIFHMDNQLALFVLQAIADTNNPEDNGLYLKSSENSNKVVGFQGYNASLINLPELNIVIEKPGVYIDTLTLFSIVDLSVVTGALPQVSQESIVVQAGFAVNSMLAFDVSRIPRNVVINNAELTLTLDTLETVVGSSYINSLAASFLADSTDADSILGSVTLSRSGSTFKGAITSFVQRWVSGDAEFDNQGILLRASDQVDGVELFALKGSSSFDALMRPLLKITYTIKK
jgi:hypothetical protein